MSNPAAPERNRHHTVSNRDDEDWHIWDTCKHGEYPGNCSHQCTQADMLERLAAKGIRQPVKDTA